MSNAVGMMREDARRRLDAIPRGCPEMRGGHAPRRRARRQRAKSAVRTRGHALPSECARRAAVSGSAFLGLAPCSGAGRFARNRAGREENAVGKEARESGVRASAHRFLFGRSRSVSAKLARICWRAKISKCASSLSRRPVNRRSRGRPARAVATPRDPWPRSPTRRPPRSSRRCCARRTRTKTRTCTASATTTRTELTDPRAGRRSAKKPRPRSQAPEGAQAA